MTSFKRGINTMKLSMEINVYFEMESKIRYNEIR